MSHEQEDIQRLIRQARRAASDEEALARVWQRLQAPPPTGPGDGGIDVPAPEALAEATQAVAGKAAIVAGLKTIAAATAIGAAIVGGRWIAADEPAAAPAAVSERSAEVASEGSSAPPAEVEASAEVEATGPGEMAEVDPVDEAGPERGEGRRGAAAKREVGPDLAAERGVLASAQAALQAGETATALRHLDEHARRFKGGLLADEREVLRVLALCAEQREVEAEAAAQSLLRTSGSGLFVPRLRGSCVGERLAPLLRPTGAGK